MYVRTYARIGTCTRTDIQICVQIYTCVHAHIYIPLNHIRLRYVTLGYLTLHYTTYLQTYTQTDMHAYIQNTYLQAHHTYTHAYLRDHQTTKSKYVTPNSAT